MGSLNQILEELLGRAPTTDNYRNDELIKEASLRLSQKQKERWSGSETKEWGFTKDTPEEQRQSALENEKLTDVSPLSGEEKG